MTHLLTEQCSKLCHAIILLVQRNVQFTRDDDPQDIKGSIPPNRSFVSYIQLYPDIILYYHDSNHSEMIMTRENPPRVDL